MANWFFHYQQEGKESPWQLALSSERENIVREKKPAFTTVLDLSAVPSDNDWTTVRYRGPLYFDFDADGDLELACEQFKNFLGKLDAELDFDITQASFFASGSKGFHIEIPQECFIPKLPPAGTAWLPYIYREMAQSLYVDTLDLKVYTGKRGRQWRTPNVKRENGKYKVPIFVDEALSITPDLYHELIVEPRGVDTPPPPVINSKMAMLFDLSKEKVTASMRGKKKRTEKANAILDPYRKAGKHPPTILKLMAGEDVSERAGFQSIAMQLAIYATSVAMPLDEFLERCRGICEHHVSDSSRYNNATKRRNELTRMYEYMQENTLYDFETDPIVRLFKPGTPAPDLGVIDTEDREDAPAATETSDDDDDEAPSEEKPSVDIDVHKSVRRGFFMNGDGMFRRFGDQVESVCRATLRKVESLYDVETDDFRGYEFDLVCAGRKTRRAALNADAFTSSQKLKQFMAAHQLSYQGSEADTAALLDIMAHKANRGGKVFVYPREGFFIINNPMKTEEDLVKVYLTQDHYQTSIPADHPDHFRLLYRPTHAVSGYNIDIHRAPKLDESMADAIEFLFQVNHPKVLGDLIGWFLACHYRSIYLHLFGQFPLLHVYGEAGAGKSKSVELMCRFHWFRKDRVQIKSASSSTNFALDTDASTSTSCPMVIDEWKPKELKTQKGKYEKLKDVLKASYIGSDIGNRGTINKGAESTLGVIKSKATAPICFMAEAIEAETAIFERSIVIALSQDLHKGNSARTVAFETLYQEPEALSAIGRAFVEVGFAIDLEKFRDEFNAIKRAIEAKMPDIKDEGRRRAAPRMIFNRAVIQHALLTLKRVLAMTFGDRFNEHVDNLITARTDALNGDEGAVAQIQGMSEISKTISRIALLSRAKDEPYEIFNGREYLSGDGWVEIKVEVCYDRYRRYCAAINDTPLFESLDTFIYALNSYSSVIDKACVNSDLRDDGSTERIVRLSVAKMRREGVQAFRT